MNWLEVAQSLNKGASRRHEHCVAGDKSAVVSAGDNGWSMWCFRCGDTVEFVPYPTPSLTERIARLVEAKTLDTAAELNVSMPLPASHNIAEWPVGHRVWLYKAGLNNDDIARLKIYYNERIDRVVLPVYVDGVPEYWQARGFDKSRAKYLNPKIAEPPLAQFGKGEEIVLVEDYLSAFRVGQVTTAYGLLGTTLRTSALSKLLVDPRPVVTWLDPDKAGIEKAKVIRKTLRACGKRVLNVRSSKDPKLLSRAEISNILSEVLHVTKEG